MSGATGLATRSSAPHACPHRTAPDIEAQMEGLLPPGGMGLFVIKSLVDEAEFVEPDLGMGNQFHMVIHLQPGEQKQ